MATWQPNTREAAIALANVADREGSLEDEINATLHYSGALSEIERLTKALEDANSYIMDMESDANSY